MQKSQELVSIIMPAYNAEKTLPQAISSALAQTYSNFELIIIDDCSTDHTHEIAQDFSRQDPRVRLLTNPHNCGASQTRHNGVLQSLGHWLAFLDSDDLWTADKLEKQLALQSHTNADLVFSGSAFIDSEGAKKDWTLHIPETISYRRLLKQNLISNSSVLVRRDLYLRCECLEEGLHEDFVCWLRLLRGGATVRGIDEPLLIYRLSPASKSGNKLKAAKMNWRAYRTAGLSVPAAVWYMGFYAFNSIIKYLHIK